MRGVRSKLSSVCTFDGPVLHVSELCVFFVVAVDIVVFVVVFEYESSQRKNEISTDLGEGASVIQKLFQPKLARVNSKTNRPTDPTHQPTYQPTVQSTNQTALGKLLPAGGPGGLPGKKFLDRTGTSPLHCAAAGGHIWCVMLLLEAGADETALNRNQCTPLEITGTSRREGLENVDMDDRIRRALIKAFLYRSLCWAWPAVVAVTGGVNSRRRAGGGVGRKARGSSSLADAAAAAAAADAAAAAAAADRQLFEQLNKTVLGKLRIFRQEQGGEPPGPAATASKIIR